MNGFVGLYLHPDYSSCKNTGTAKKTSSLQNLRKIDLSFREGQVLGTQRKDIVLDAFLLYDYCWAHVVVSEPNIEFSKSLFSRIFLYQLYQTDFVFKEENSNCFQKRF